jgi:biopolymer transport protein ExbD
VKANLDNGTIASIVIETGASKKILPEDAWQRQLSAELKKLRADGPEFDTVRIKADKKVKWASIVQVMDSCKEAGFTNIGFAPPPEE